MLDDLNNRGPADRMRVDLGEKWEITYWCRKFGCGEPQLREAVNRVGGRAEDVYLALTTK